MKPRITKGQLYKVWTYEQRRSLIYSWFILNDEEHLFLGSDNYTLIKNSLHSVRTTMYELSDQEILWDGRDEKKLEKKLKKLPEFRLMIDWICDEYNLNYINLTCTSGTIKKHREIVNPILNIKVAYSLLKY